MPNIVRGNNNSLQKALVDIDNAKFDYKYPGDLNLKPGTPLHDRIVKEVIDRAYESYGAISKRYPSWRRQDRTLTTYQYVDETEEKVKDKDERKPVSIVFPYSYAVLETLLTYLCAAFFRDPIFEYEGVSDDDVIGGKLLTLLIRMHCFRSKVPLALHTMFRDSLAYGIGPVAPSWKRRYGGRIVEVMGSAYDIAGTEVAGESIKNVEKGLVFEGNTLDNIDPYKFLPDPNVASHKIQDGEYVGWWYQTNVHSLLSDEINNEDRFNVKYLKLIKNRNSFLSSDESDRQKKEGRTDLSSSTLTTKTDTIVMYIDLIPSEWGLGDSDYPEKWWFEVNGDAILTLAKKIDQNHGMYPLTVSCPDFDGYSPTPLSRLETVYGLQHTMDFLFNSHIANVRKAVNDMLVIDPWMININDVKDPKAGKLIRTRRPSWGKGAVKDYISQLGIVDVTRNNIADSSYIAQWMQKLTSADDSMMGALRQGGPERLTTDEFNATRGSGMSRLGKLAQMISYQAMMDIAFFFASHAQQYISQSTWVQVLGDLPDKLIAEYASSQPNGVSRVKIKPSDLYIEYDLIPRDGTIPGTSDVSAWIKMYEILVGNPAIAQRFDMVRIFTHIARELGAKNVDEFKLNMNQIKTQTMPDEQVMQELQKGNLKPVEGAING